ncbi:MAG: LpqB family beta-propeller domain-containing protein [Actinomyces sp.]|uniref:GerMN domain-containing protein n=1 Tax=Actinomyces sp. TaxID=29317 RepID=UPI0026DCA8B4|nr:GerMN domain-containing protein [Actinomyces sp.]MDO4242272.1 LpqB family beta-propeller domain-containing protein [Actinomyces sp.]
MPRRWVLTALPLGAVGLGACAGAPRSGDIGESDVVEVDDSMLVQTAAGPAEGATPEQIVSGFLRACVAGFFDGFATARSFLLTSAAGSWDPVDTVRVYPGSEEPVVTRAPDGSVLVEADLLGSVGEHGIFSAADATGYSETFTLAVDAHGQWRIATLLPGVLVPVSGLSSNFRATALYFLTPDRQRLVPELRWLPRSSLLPRLVEAFIAGPSPWLAGGVVTALPAGAALEEEVSDPSAGTVTVRLSGGRARVPDEDLSLLVAQLWESLREVDSVSRVSVYLDGVPLPQAASLPEVGASPGPLVGMSGGNVVQGTSSTRATLVAAAALGTTDARHPALGTDGSVYVLSASSLLRAGAGQAAASAILSAGAADAAAGGLLPPVVDRHAWVWTAADGRLTVVNHVGQRPELSVPWLDGREVIAFDLSAESARCAVRHRAGQDERVSVAVVRRDADGVPVGLGEALDLVGADGAQTSSVVWYDTVSVAVLAPHRQDEEVRDVLVLEVAGTASATVGARGAVAIASDRVGKVMSLTDSSNRVWQRSRTTWRVVATDVTDVSYPLV